MSKNNKIEFIYIGKCCYSDSKLQKSVKEGDKIYVDTNQVDYIKKIKINGIHVFEEQNKKEEKQYKPKLKKEEKKDLKELLDD